MGDKLESEFQKKLIAELKSMLPGCIILKNDEQYRMGIPDLTVLWEDRWCFLEVKRSEREEYQPLQEYYLEKAYHMSYSATIYPENKNKVLAELEREWEL